MRNAKFGVPAALNFILISVCWTCEANWLRLHQQCEAPGSHWETSLTSIRWRSLISDIACLPPHTQNRSSRMPQSYRVAAQHPQLKNPQAIDLKSDTSDYVSDIISGEKRWKMTPQSRSEIFFEDFLPSSEERLFRSIATVFASNNVFRLGLVPSGLICKVRNFPLQNPQTWIFRPVFGLG